MIWNLVERDIKSRYAGSSLGVFWSIIHPISQLLVYYFVFSLVMKARLGPEYGGAHFAVWLMVGLLPWMFFSEVVLRAPTLVIEQANMIKKMVFPSELLPFSHLAAAALNHIMAFLLLLVLVLFLKADVSIQMLYVVPNLVALAVFALGCSWLISSLNVFLRDIGQVLGVLMHIWFYLTPVVYPKSIVPDALQGMIRWNPLLHVVEGYRRSLLGMPVSDFRGFLYLSLSGICVFAVGGYVFKKLKPAFPDAL